MYFPDIANMSTLPVKELFHRKNYQQEGKRCKLPLAEVPLPNTIVVTH